MKTIIFISIGLTLIMGICCIFFPEKIQEIALKYSENKLNPFLGWMKTKSYIITLRVIGIAAISSSVVALFVLLKN